jgi:Domain of unknown function (DUF4440)
VSGHDPAFRQRFSISVQPGERRLSGKGEMSREGAPWEGYRAYSLAMRLVRPSSMLLVMFLSCVLAGSGRLNTAFGASAARAESSEAVLQRQTQELMNAVTAGSAEVWQRYLDDKARITDEGGQVHTKSGMIKDIGPLPAGVSGTIAVTDFSAVVKGNVAIATYISEEHENYHGQQLHCQYRSTDTWVRTADNWRLLSSQVLALRTDPPPAHLRDEDVSAYVGRFQLAPGFVYEIRRQGAGLERQRTGRAAESLVAEAPDVFFAPGSPRYRTIFRRDAGGRVVDFVERREAWDLVWTRLPD